MSKFEDLLERMSEVKSKIANKEAELKKLKREYENLDQEFYDEIMS